MKNSLNSSSTMDRSLTYGLVAVIVIVASFLCDGVSGARAPSPIDVNKCCRLGEHLDKSTRQCLIGDSDQWWPLIFLILKQQYFTPHGEAPRFMHPREHKQPICEQPELVDGSMALFSNGSLFLSERNAFIEPDNFCVDKAAALVCLTRPQGADSLRAPVKLTKIRKCCAHRSVYNTKENTCAAVDEGHELINKKLISNASTVDFLFGFPTCKVTNHFAIAGKFNEEHLNLETGSLTMNSARQFKWDEFCLEHTIADDIDEPFVNVFTCAEHLTVADTISVPKRQQESRLMLYSIGLLISVIFLLATLATGFILPSNHHVLHWRCQTFYVGCLLVGDLLLAMNQIFGAEISRLPCFSLAVATQFFFLAAFFWLNTMCFNIWWTFRDFRPTSMEKGHEKVRLRIYKFYAWGVPLIITGIAAILDNLPKSLHEAVLRPRFGEKKCWFAGDMEILAYFYGPIGLLLCVNLLMFASTAHQLTFGLWKRDDVKSTTERAALGRVCMKLVIVMGITWVADVLSWIAEVLSWGNDDDYFWYAMDLINALQGVLIFIVVGCQPQVSSAVKRMWGSKNGRCTLNTTHGQQHSSSSQGLPSVGDSMTNNTFNNTTSSKIPMETIC